MKYLLIFLTFVGCKKYVSTGTFTECGKVVQTHYEPEHSHTSSSTNSEGETEVHTETIDAKWTVVFSCEHGQFVSEGTDLRHKRLWQRMKPGLQVEITSSSIHEQLDDGGVGKFHDFNFIDAKPKPGCVTKMEQPR